MLAGVVAGVAAAGLGAWMAVAGVDPGVAAAHRQLNILGLLGLSIVGAAYQFYPPAVGPWRFSTDRTARVSIAALAGGLAVQSAGLIAGWPAVTAVGEAVGAFGAALFGLLVVGLFVARGELTAGF
ncbi:MAG: hypothetical protein V5A33_02145, partial [Halobacteriales archaeon]